MAYASIGELMANLPDFDKNRLEGGRSPYSQPVMPGEQRLIPRMQDMQDKLQPALPPVRKAQIDADQFLTDYLMGFSRPMALTESLRDERLY